MILVLDCNIWITLTLNREIDFLADLSDEGITLATCELLRNEINSVLNRPKFSRYISTSDIDKVIELHALVTKNYTIGKIIKVTADKNDDYLFALCIKAKVDYLVTGDKLLLSVNKYKRTEIITLSQLRGLIAK